MTSRSKWWWPAALAALVWAGCGGNGGAGDGTGNGQPDAADSGGDAADDGSAGGSGDAVEEPGPTVSCDPAPERCDALGEDRPGRLSEHGAAYDPERLEMIVFGGSSAVAQQCDIPSPVYSDTTWIFDDPCGRWTQLEVAGPGPRSRHMMAWGGGYTWLFGGRYRSPEANPLTTPYTLYDDLWRFDGAARTWEAVPTVGDRPPARVSGSLVWDSHRQALWLFGGNTSAAGTSYIPQQDLWRFDPGEGRWTREHPSGQQPPARLFHAALYDAQRDQLVVYGGADETAFDFSQPVHYMRDLWALDLESLTWTRLSDGSDGPEGRFWAALVDDTVADRYLVFGGHDDGSLGNRNDSWTFNPSDDTWTQLAEGDVLQDTSGATCNLPPDFTAVDPASPERRNAHTLVWSDACGRATLFGGKTDCGAVDDVWSHDADGWMERLPATEGEVCYRWRNNPANCVSLCL